MEISELIRQNPWWLGKEKVGEDEDFVKWEKSEIKWYPKLLDTIPLEAFSLNFIFGPRQVGKTTALKLLIDKLLASGGDKDSIFYFRCDKLKDFHELEDVLTAYFSYRDSKKIVGSVIMLDEITYPDEWYRTIKFYIDTGAFKNDVLVLTGSLSMYVKGEVETFPGRRGKGKDVIFYPLSFREFIGVAKKGLYEKLPAIKQLDGRAMDKIKTILQYKDEIDKLFEVYIRSGGFPLTIKDTMSRGKISDQTVDVYVSSIKGDLLKTGYDPDIAKEVIKSLIEREPSTISWLSVAKATSIKSHSTVYSYINMLEKLFFLKIFYFIDPSDNSINLNKEKKVHLLDPSLFFIFSSWSMAKMPEKSVEIETIVASHLARAFDAFYWKGSHEIDVVARTNGKLTGVEVKWTDDFLPRRISIGKMKEVFYLSKSVFDADSRTIPVTMFLSCFDV
jgi:predicted AAA+ superfamily ATPase